MQVENRSAVEAPQPNHGKADTGRPVSTTAPRRSRLNRSLATIVIVTLAVLAAAGCRNGNAFVVAPPPQITPILPPTITRAPSPTPLVVEPTVAAPSATAVSPEASATPLPPVTYVVVTSEPPTVEAFPTLLPTITPAPTSIPPTSAPPTAKPPTLAPPTKTPPSCPPGLCVTNIVVSPNQPKRNQDVTFTATFVNATGSTQNYPWLILLFDPNKAGPNKGFGESTASPISIPPGISQFSITHIAVTGPGGCITLYAQAGWKISAFNKPLFPNSDGQPLSVYFDVCP